MNVPALVVILTLCAIALGWSVYMLARGPWVFTRPSWLLANTEVVTHRRFFELHREDGPAMIHRRTDTESRQEKFYLRGKLRFDGKPGYVRYDDHGVKTRESYYDSTGELHRLDGPADIQFHKDRMVSGEWFYLGQLVSDFDGILDCLDADHPQRAVYLLRHSPYAELLTLGTVPEITAVLRSGFTSVESAREILRGTPPEWVRAFEDGVTA